MAHRISCTCALLFLVPLSVGSVHANIIDCRPPESVSYIVNLNEPDDSAQVFRSRQEMLAFFNQLHDHLDQKRDLEMAGIPALQFHVARCEGRRPKLDGSEFTATLVDRLLNDKVVIEVWGALGTRQVGVRKEPAAQMNYLILPVRHASDGGATQAPSLHRFNYPDGEIKAHDYVELISNLDLHAFITAAIGVRAFDNDRFAEAHEFLCRSGAKLGTIRARLARSGSTKAQSEAIESLRAYLVELASKARKQIGNAADKATSASVRLQDPNNPCSDAGGQP